jgi:uncharacterized protein (UPF0332 family)
MNEELRKLVHFRLDRAFESLDDAKLLADARRWNPCINRLYYACFYAVSALLAANELSSSKHSGVLSLFNLHFVKSGKIPKDIAETYSDLFDNRQEGDYSDFIRFTEQQVKPQIDKTSIFLKAVADMIGNCSQ